MKFRGGSLAFGCLTPRVFGRLPAQRFGCLAGRASGRYRVCRFDGARPFGGFELLWLCCVMVVLGVVLISTRAEAQTPTAKPIEVVGRFVNVKHVGDDALGYSLRLWKQGDQIFGLLSVYTGAQADPPVGLLEDVKFDPRTRSFSFSARLSTGLVSGRGYSSEPSHDRFTFSGMLTKKEVNGVLKRADELFPGDRPESKRIRLSYSEQLTQVMLPAPASYSEWKSWADEVLQRRGPKW